MKNFNWQNYYDAITPKKVKKVADAIWGACSAITGFAIIGTYVKTGLIILVIGFAAKFFSDWFKDDDVPKS